MILKERERKKEKDIVFKISGLPVNVCKKLLESRLINTCRVSVPELGSTCVSV